MFCNSCRKIREFSDLKSVESKKREAIVKAFESANIGVILLVLDMVIVQNSKLWKFKQQIGKLSFCKWAFR